MSERPMRDELPRCADLWCWPCCERTRALLAPLPTTRDKVVALARAGRSTREIADELNLTPAAVSSHKSRARKKK